MLSTSGPNQMKILFDQLRIEYSDNNFSDVILANYQI